MAVPTYNIPKVLKERLLTALRDRPAWKYLWGLLNALMGTSTNLPVAYATISVGAEAANIILVTIQLTDGQGSDMAERTWIQYYLSDDAAGDTVSSDPGTVAIGTDGTIIKEHTDDVYGTVLSEADGDIDLNITHTSTSGYYLQLLMPNGKKKASAIIQFA